MSSAQKGKHMATLSQGMSRKERLFGGGRLSMMYRRSCHQNAIPVSHDTNGYIASVRVDRTSSEMLGWVAGELDTTMTHRMTHAMAAPPNM
jgi:hypothetical protein